MELKAGYKHSEVGTIPRVWRVEKFCNVTKVITCGLAATPIYVDEQYGKPFLSAQNVRNGKVVYDRHKFIDNELFMQITKHNKPQKGDILYTRVGAGIGEAAVIEDDYEFGIYVSLTLIKIDPKKIRSRYIAQLLNSDKYKFLAKAGQFAGGGVQNLNVEVVRDFYIPVPSLSEQEAIAEALSDADALIESLEQLIAKKRQIKQGAMQELLTGKRRLPGFEKKPGYKQTEVGVIPDDWETDYVENFADITTGSRNTQDRVEGGQYPFFVRSQVVERINSYSFDGEAVLTAGDGVGTGKVFHYINGKFDVHQRVYRISRFNECINGYYFYLYFSTHFYDRIMQMTAKSSVDSVRMDMIANMLVPLPPTKAEQEAIATILRDMDAIITALEAKLAKARQIKQGMMQELLTGRIRLI